MKNFTSLEDVIKFMFNKHRNINSPAHGVTGYKFLRKPDGSRLLFEQVKGFRIFRHFIHSERDLTLETMGTGILFKKNIKITVSSHLFLSNLAVINVYDHRTEFFSANSIDFAYIENEYSAEVQMMQEWLSKDAGQLRGQWLAKDEIVDKILNEISISRHMDLSDKYRRRHLSLQEEIEE